MAIYVDDILAADETQRDVEDVLQRLERKFQLRWMGQPNFFLGMNLAYNRSQRRLVLTQTTYISALVNKYQRQMQQPRGLPTTVDNKIHKCDDDSNFTEQPYKSLVGALLFI
jgi:hypothetical protein